MVSLLRKITLPLVERRIIYKFLSSIVDPVKQQQTKDENKLKQNLLISDSCKKRLQQICNDESFLRVIIEGGGCSGFQYKFDIDNKINEDDLIFGEGKSRVVIDTISLEYCNGATIDYHTELIRSGFRIIGNPKADHGCSCGASFSIKID